MIGCSDLENPLINWFVAYKLWNNNWTLVRFNDSIGAETRRDWTDGMEMDAGIAIFGRARLKKQPIENNEKIQTLISIFINTIKTFPKN